MKVLISAYACEPGKGSEPGVGWNLAREISRFHEVWVITRANNKLSIESALGGQTMTNVRWLYFDLPRWARVWKRGQRGVRLYYLLWQVGAFIVGRNYHRKLTFDLVHHVTFVNYWLPTFFSHLDTNFVWGPLGGGEYTPDKFIGTYTLRGRLYEGARDIIRQLAEHNPLQKVAARRAIITIAATPQTADRLKRLGSRNVQVISQVGLAIEEFQTLASIPIRKERPGRFVSVGRLIHWKGLHLSLQALSQMRGRHGLEYWIIGDGPERTSLHKLAAELDLEASVRFLGNLPREEVFEALSKCDILLHPSLHDSGGWVCAEALAAGRPVICLDWGGPGLQITEECGIKIPPNDPSQTILDLAGAMQFLVENSHLRKQMGRAGRERARDHLMWPRKAERISRLYEAKVLVSGLANNR